MSAYGQCASKMAAPATFLFSSKFAAPVVPPAPAAPGPPTFLPSSKTITPLVVPTPPVLRFSESGRPVPQAPAGQRQ